MSKSLAVQYAIQKRNAQKKAMGGEIKCAHGGRVLCNAGCYSSGGEVNPKLHEAHMADGGEVEELHDDLDEGLDFIEDLDEKEDLLSVPEPHEDEAAKKNRILSRIFGSIKKSREA